MTPKRDRTHIVTEYAKLASEYDSRWSSYIRMTTDATLARMPSELGDVLDVGCGTGAILSSLVDQFPASKLTGVDASSEMLQIAKDRLPPQVELRTGWAEELAFEHSSFDTVVCCNVFHFIRHPDQALQEMLRVLRPGGVIIITDWCDDYLTCKLCDIYLRWSDPSHFRMYGVSEFQQLIEEAGASQVQIHRYKVTWLWGLMTASATKPSVAAGGEASSTS